MKTRIPLILLTLLCLLFANFALERPAYAYIDPGTGLLLLQNISGLAAGVLFFFRRRIKALFGRSSKNPEKTSENIPDERR